jgi:hypothetical protein
MTQDEQRAALDGDLARSLSEFDGMLQQEQAMVGSQRDSGSGSTRAENQEARQAGGGAGRGELGDEDGTEETPVGSGAEGTDTGGSTETPAGTPEPGAPVGAGEVTGGDDSRVPRDVGDGRDDDIVARQLREAAMQEEDPELREKLWEEYRRYKRGG